MSEITSLEPKQKIVSVAKSIFRITLTVFIICAVVYVIGMYYVAEPSPKNKLADAQRINDIGQLQLALEQYFDTSQHYPATLQELEGNTLVKIPVDSDGTGYVYAQLLDGKSYALGASLQTDTNAMLAIDRDAADATFPTADTSGCRGETKRHCYDIGNSSISN